VSWPEHEEYNNLKQKKIKTVQNYVLISIFNDFKSTIKVSKVISKIPDRTDHSFFYSFVIIFSSNKIFLWIIMKLRLKFLVSKVEKKRKQGYFWKPTSVGMSL
jgi:hypothetical protein